jgi:flagellin-like protein
LGLIKDAATDAPGREIDYLDDNGIHQIKPASGVYCTVNLWLNDTISAPSYINYTQTSSGVYKMQSKLQVIRIRVINIPEPRPDYNFDEEYGFNFHHVQGVLAGTRIPVTVNLEHDGDEPPNSDGTYKYKHDLYVKFYTDDDPRTVQSQVRIGCNGPYTGQAASCADDPKVLKLAGFGNDVLVKASYIQNSGTSQVRAFVDIKTVCPTGTSCAGSYIPSSIRRPSLEDHTEPNPPYRWTNNNQTTNDTSQKLPKIINLQPAEAVASFAPSFIAVSVVGMFVGAMLLKNRREEDDEEFEEDTMEDDEMAVSPVIATILLVAITVVLAGVIYVWAGQLADVSTKAPPRLTFDPDARYDHTSDQNLWYWKLRVTYAANELATQAIFVTVEWDTANGAQFYKTTLANRSGVYGFIPSNSDKFVTFFDNIDLQQSRPITTFGVDDSIQVRMMDPDGNMIERAVITVSYEPAGRYTPLATFTGTSNPPKIG